MGHAARFDDTALEESLVTSIVVADELPRPVTQELAGMHAAATLGKVINDGLKLIVFARAVAPEVRPMRASQARLQHWHRRLIRVQYGSSQQLILHRPDERL